MISDIDIQIILWTQRFFGVETRQAWMIITGLGGHIVVVLAVMVPFWIGRPRAGVQIFFTAMISALFTDCLKVFLGHPRPYYVYAEVEPLLGSSGFGMPSGHASTAASVWGSAALLSQRKAVHALAILLTFLAGASRIYLGVHSLGQIMVGWAVGVAVVLAVYKMQRPAMGVFRKLSGGSWLWPASALAIFLLFLHTAILVDHASRIDIPSSWEERFIEARESEGHAVNNGAGDHEAESLSAYEPSWARGGFIAGMWLLIILVSRKEKQRLDLGMERIAAPAVGLVFLGVLFVLFITVEGSLVAEAAISAAVPLVSGWAGPQVGRKLCFRKDK